MSSLQTPIKKKSSVRGPMRGEWKRIPAFRWCEISGAICLATQVGSCQPVSCDWLALLCSAVHASTDTRGDESVLFLSSSCGNGSARVCSQLVPHERFRRFWKVQTKQGSGWSSEIQSEDVLSLHAGVLTDCDADVALLCFSHHEAGILSCWRSLILLLHPGCCPAAASVPHSQQSSAKGKRYWIYLSLTHI